VGSRREGFEGGRQLIEQLKQMIAAASRPTSREFDLAKRYKTRERLKSHGLPR
jgi:hypothetical protein